MTQDTEVLGDFFDYIWHDTEGAVYLPHDNAGDMDLKKVVFQWPRQRKAVIDYVLKHAAQGDNVFYGPGLYDPAEPRGAGQKDNFLASHVLWVDFDGNAPTDWSEQPIPEPDMRNRSSLPGHEHVYWQLDEPITDPATLEDRNRALAYSLDADTSGWDANQILRPINTPNFPSALKISRGERSTVEQVVNLQWVDNAHDLEEFGAITSAKQLIANTLAVGDLPDISDVIALNKWTPEFWEKFQVTQEDLSTPEAKRKGGRSAAMQELAYLGAEQGFSDEQIMAVLQNADTRWEKYLYRHNRERLLVDIVNRARQKHGYLTGSDLTFAGLEGSAEEATDGPLVYGFNDFVESEFHIEWVYEGLLAEEGYGFITGFPGVGKTQYGIQMSCSLALGTDFLDWKYAQPSPKKVLFLSLEMGEAPMHLFLSTIAESYTPAELNTLNQNFKVFPHGRPLPLDTPEGQRFFEALLSEYQPDMVFIDSLGKVSSKSLTDEEAARTLAHYLMNVKAKYHCGVYMIHHNRKKSNDAQKKDGVELSDVYGSTYLMTDADFVISLRYLTEGAITVDTLKMRLGPEVRPQTLYRDQHLTYHTDHLNFAEGTNDAFGL